MKLARLALMVFLFWIAFAPVLQAQPQDEGTFSENKKFVAVISESEVNIPKLTVFRMDNEVRTFHWTKELISKEESEAEGFFPPGYEHEFNRWVSNDGSVVILRKGHSLSGEDLFLRALRKDGGDKSFTMLEFLEPVVDSIQQELTFIKLDQPVELFLTEESRAAYAYWDALSGRWLELDSTSLTLMTPKADREKKLNSLGLARARETVRRYQPETVSKILAPVKEKAQQLLPGLMAEQEYELPVGSYRFLAKQKHPEDKRSIEKLLEQESSEEFEEELVCTGEDCTHYFPERALGDELLAQWEGKAWDAARDFWDDSRTPVYLAQVRGTVRLPFVAPKNAGSIRVFLIPNDLKGTEWQRSKKVLTIRHALEDTNGMGGGPVENPETSQVQFSFNTITPGAYRLKAIWDRRPPHSEGIAGGGELASAGDYESSETVKLDLRAGSPASNLILQCTNRVGQAAEYFAADDLWKLKNPPWYAEAPQSLPEKVLFAAPATDWIAATNQNPLKLRFKSIRYTEESNRSDLPRMRALQVSFTVPREPETKPKSNGMNSGKEWLYFSGVLIDSHGCKFEHQTVGQSNRDYEIGFPIVPLGEEQFLLELKVRNSEAEEKIAAILQMKNLIKPQAATLNASQLPVKQELGMVAISLEEIPPDFHESIPKVIARRQMSGSDYVNSRGRGLPASTQPRFRFMTNSQSATGWKKSWGILSDRWGNIGWRLSDFCVEEEEFNYRATFVRDERNGSFREDEKWEVALKKVPGPGESVPLEMVKEIQGAHFQLYSVGGTGEYTYERGKLISATDKIEELPQQPSGSRPQRELIPKLYVKTGQMKQGAAAMGTVSAFDQSELTIVSRIPHLVCRFPLSNADLHFGVLEQDFSVIEPREVYRGQAHFVRADRRIGPQFVALDYRPGETDKKITLIVQKPVVADFAIKIPKNLRRKPGRDSD